MWALVQKELYVGTGTKGTICRHWYKRNYMSALVQKELYVGTGTKGTICGHWYKRGGTGTLIETGTLLEIICEHLHAARK
jgi:hypothetical protein